MSAAAGWRAEARRYATSVGRLALQLDVAKSRFLIRQGKFETTVAKGC